MLENIVKALKKDHEDLKKFIQELKKKPDNTESYRSFASLLRSHAASEEKVLYERCMKVTDLAEKAEEGFIEHHVASSLMKGIEATKQRRRKHAQVKVLVEMIEHHIEEEESEFFPEIEEHFNNRRSAEMAHEFLALRKRSQRNVHPGNAGILNLD